MWNPMTSGGGERSSAGGFQEKIGPRSVRSELLRLALMALQAPSELIVLFYNISPGKDASRAFATGDFTPAGLVDDISGLSPSEMLIIQNWLSFYTKNYVRIGR